MTGAPRKKAWPRARHRRPLPKGEGDEAADVYMNYLELLASGIPRAIFVVGQRDAEVITMYS